MWVGMRNQGATDRGRRRSGWVAATAAIAVIFTSTAAGPVSAEPSGVSVDSQLELKDDGALTVTAVITAPQGRATAQRLPLSVSVEGNRTQHFTVNGLRAENGSAAVSDDALQISAPGGSTKVTYTVRGTVSDGPELQQFTWPIAAGYTTDLDKVTMRFVSPTAVPDSPLCGIGQVGERRMCTFTQTDSSGVVTAQQNGLPRGKVAVFTTLLPSGTVAADARFTPTSSSAPERERDTGGLIAISLAVVLAVALAGYGYVRRRADLAAAESVGPTADLLVPGGDGGVAFASPDGVLPGQVGTLLDGRPRPTDIGSTVLDLAVRGYLWLAALPGGDFQISRRTPLDGAVTAAERAVVDALLPGGAETTTVSELTGGARPLDLAQVHAETYSGIADRGWLRPRPRSALFVPAITVAAGGALATLICAFLNTGVLYAAAVLVLGLGLTAAALLWPRRTTSGSRLAAGLGGMRQFLIATNIGSLPEEQRDVLFERAIPYTHAFGDLRGWLATWGPATTTPLDWYRSGQGPVAGLATLAVVLDGAVAQAQAAQRD